MNETIESILKRYGVLKEGHFQLTSGLHSGQYFEKFRILEHPELVTRFAGKIADEFRDKGVTIVCGPTTGGVIIAFEVARQLEARCVVAEKNDGGGRKIGRGFQFGAEDRILVVDDVLTTGGSIKDTLDALKAFPGTVIGIAVFIDRSAQPPGDNPLISRKEIGGLSLFAVYHRTVQNHKPEDCPLCRQGVPLAARH